MGWLLFVIVGKRKCVAQILAIVGWQMAQASRPSSLCQFLCNRRLPFLSDSGKFEPELEAA